MIHLRRLAWVPAALFCLTFPWAVASAQGSPAWTRIQGWAGKDAATVGFTQERFEAFLEARRTDVLAGATDTWKPWLESLARGKAPALRTWAQARLVEAGVYESYPAFLEAAVAHLKGQSQFRSGEEDAVLPDPPASRDRVPGVFQLDSRCAFWNEVETQVRSKPEMEVSANLYAVWCHGTFRDQRALILDLAAQTKAPRTLANTVIAPWNDPRFWIVVDWAMAWGTPADFDALASRMTGPAQTAFVRIQKRLQEQPLFFHPDPSIGSQAVALISFTDIKPLGEVPKHPLYPEEARSRGLMTRLEALVTVGPEGRVVAFRPLPGPWLAFFAQAAEAWASLHRFEPAPPDGKVAYRRFVLPLVYRLRAGGPTLPVRPRIGARPPS